MQKLVAKNIKKIFEIIYRKLLTNKIKDVIIENVDKNFQTYGKVSLMEK